MGPDMLRWFAYDHLPEDLQAVSRPFWTMAVGLCEGIEDGRERAAGLRKLLEAKDCFVRAAIEARD